MWQISPWQRAGAVGQQPAREESPCFGSCAQLWLLSQNKIDWHRIPGDSPVSPAIPPGEIPGDAGAPPADLT